MINRTALPKMTDNQFNTHLEIVDRMRERNAKYKTHILRKFFDIRRLHFPATLGSFAWSSSAISTKWLSEPHSVNLGGGYVTPGDMARDYLAIKYANRRIRCTADQWRKCVSIRKQPPLFVQPQRLDQASYLDLTGAFWQIVRAVGWDVNYNPGKYLNSQSRMIDFPYSYNKMARNCLVSVGIPAPMRLWTGTEVKFVKKQSKFVNLILWTLVQDVLNNVAVQMVEAGAIYVNTDGYIFPDYLLKNGFGVLEDWGLQGTIKHTGTADVRGLGTYSFSGGREGSYATENFRRRPNRPARTLNKMYEQEMKWLRPRFKKLADFAKYEWEWFDK